MTVPRSEIAGNSAHWQIGRGQPRYHDLPLEGTSGMGALAEVRPPPKPRGRERWLRTAFGQAGHSSKTSSRVESRVSLPRLRQCRGAGAVQGPGGPTGAPSAGRPASHHGSLRGDSSTVSFRVCVTEGLGGDQVLCPLARFLPPGRRAPTRGALTRLAPGAWWRTPLPRAPFKRRPSRAPATATRRASARALRAAGRAPPGHHGHGLPPARGLHHPWPLHVHGRLGFAAPPRHLAAAAPVAEEKKKHTSRLRAGALGAALGDGAAYPEVSELEGHMAQPRGNAADGRCPASPARFQSGDELILPE